MVNRAEIVVIVADQEVERVCVTSMPDESLTAFQERIICCGGDWCDKYGTDAVQVRMNGQYSHHLTNGLRHTYTLRKGR